MNRSPRSSRRAFLGVAGTGTAGLALLGREARAGGVPGARKPAPGAASTGADASRLDSSPLERDRKIAEAAVAAATKAGASYADARLVSWRRESVGARDDHVSHVSRSEEYGIGVRVIADGAWGFAATNRVDEKNAKKAAQTAVEAAKAQASLLVSPVELAPVDPGKGRWVSPHRIDPFSVPVNEKAEYLIDVNKAALAAKGVRFANSQIYAVREEKLLVTSEGAQTHQLFFRIMPSLTATAVDRRRGLFASRNHEIQPMLAGWEHVVDNDMLGGAPRVAQETLQKLHAKSVEPGTRTVVIAPSNLWLTIHESIGHPTELDRSIGLEANYAGTSFLKVEDAGKLKIGDGRVNFVADRTQPGGLATTMWDDDGAISHRWDMVKDGIFVGWQTTRDQAGWIGDKRGHACSYGDGYGSVQFQRMPNISLQPGPEGFTTEDLINATDDGILISGRGSWSIDHQRYNFQFGGQFFWEIKNGRLTRPLRDVAYQANTVEFWNSCDMIGGADTYRLGGSFSDGKGGPGQSNAVSHGCPPARFKVRIVNTGGDR